MIQTDDSNSIRLQVYLSRAGVCSRRAAEKQISAGVVSVNGKVCRELGTKVVPGEDVVAYRGRVVELEDKVLYLFHKPRSVVSTLSDPEGRKCISDFLDKDSERVFPVGRLDVDVSGILLLTNDGEFSERLLHPRFQVPRRYVARVRGKLDEEIGSKLVSGVALPDGPGRASEVKSLGASSQLQRLVGPLSKGQCYIELTVTEGRNHFIKNLLEGVSRPVVKLSRIAFGPYLLKGLKEGELSLSSFKKVIKKR